MKRVEAILRPTKLEPVKIALGEIGVSGMSVSDVRGRGREKGYRENMRGHERLVDLALKVKLEVVVHDEEVDEVVETILTHARTGEPGDGKIFVMPVGDAIRVRTEERGEEAL